MNPFTQFFYMDTCHLVEGNSELDVIMLQRLFCERLCPFYDQFCTWKDPHDFMSPTKYVRCGAGSCKNLNLNSPHDHEFHKDEGAFLKLGLYLEGFMLFICGK